MTLYGRICFKAECEERFSLNDANVKDVAAGDGRAALTFG
jgi:hypothetical protein